ncbi:MAG: hypothetical protein DRJ06_08885 [Candidatus Aminicenantes bacterium]|nr:MAG: hypothetical protein DRJ06_08885 [Candidatus Aminicenantes bacterium]
MIELFKLLEICQNKYPLMDKGETEVKMKKKRSKASSSTASTPPSQEEINFSCSPEKVSLSLIKHSLKIAEECRANALLVYADALGEKELSIPTEDSILIYLITRTQAEEAPLKRKGHLFIRVPEVPLNRMAQVKMATLIALSQGKLKKGDTIVFLTGPAESDHLDTLMVMQIGLEHELFLAPTKNDKIAPYIKPEVLNRVIEIATELGSEGREGKPVGALFVIGDTEKIKALSKQLILNPFRGYPEAKRNILDPALEETVKEYAMLDGAFLIRGDGVIETMGAHLKVGAQQEFELPQGLGARHHAAAGITAVTEAVAVTLSESTGTVTVFKEGKIVTEIEKLRTLSRHEEF